MGKNSAPHPSRGWIVHYRGGGPLDGAVRILAKPIQGHYIPTADPAFVGHQRYDIAEWDEGDRVIHLEYSGESWGPPPA